MDATAQTALTSRGISKEPDSGKKVDKETYKGTENEPNPADNNKEYQNKRSEPFKFEERRFISGRQDASENMGTIERKERNQIEEGERDIDHYPEEKKMHYPGGQIKCALPQRSEHQAKGQTQTHIGQRPGLGYPEIGDPGITKVIWIDRDRFGPAEAEAREKHHDSSEKIEMCQRIQGQPSQIAGGIIAETIRNIGVEKLMDRQRK